MSLRAQLAVLALTPFVACLDHTQQGGGENRPTSRPVIEAGEQSGGAKPPQPIVETRAAIPDVAGLDALLAKVVHGSKVDYAGVAKEREVLDQYLAKAAAADVSQAPKTEQLAFWINTYNAATLARVLKYVRGRGKNGKDLAGVLEVKKVHGRDFFKEKSLIVGGALMSLDDIEHRGRDLGDPRIHFAVNCASVSCPPLKAGAYKAATLEADLDAVTKAYFASPQGLRVKGRRVFVTKLLSWYEGDFGGSEGAKNFVRAHAPKAALEFLDKDLGWLDYDWRLNKT